MIRVIFSILDRSPLVVKMTWKILVLIRRLRPNNEPTSQKDFTQKYINVEMPSSNYKMNTGTLKDCVLIKSLRTRLSGL